MLWWWLWLSGSFAVNALVIRPDVGSRRVEQLLKDLSAYASMPLESAKTFPPEAYTNEDLFDLERSAIFRAGWLCVAHVSQVRNRGDFTSIDMVDELMVVVNDGESVKTLSRVCPHRWAPICEGSGTCTKFTCPFHHWSFDLKGDCVAAPLMEDQIDISTQGMHEYRTEIVGGFVFVNIDGNAPDLDVEEMTQYLKNWETESLERYIEIEYECDFNWKIVVETFMECYHHLGAHSTTFEPNFPAKLSWTEDARNGWTMGHCSPRPGREQSAFEMGLPHFPKLEATFEKQAYALFNVFPTHLMHAMPDRLLWFKLQPISADRTVVTTYCLVHPDALASVPEEDYDQIYSEQYKIMDDINREDIAVNEMQQIGARAGAVKPGPLNAKHEKALWQLNAFVADRLSSFVIDE